MALDHMDVVSLTIGCDVNSDRHVNKAATRRLLETCSDLARDLRDLHASTGISLDNWVSARTFVEAFTGPVEDNHA